MNMINLLKRIFVKIERFLPIFLKQNIYRFYYYFKLNNNSINFANNSIRKNYKIINYDKSFLKKNYSAKKLSLFDFDKKKITTNVCFFTSFRGRHNLVETNIIESKYLNLNVSWVLVGSTYEDELFLNKMKLKYDQKYNISIFGFITDNEPLGRKWLITSIIAKYYIESNFYIVLGSDDIFSHQNLNILSKYLKHEIQNVDLFYTNYWYITNYENIFELYKCYYNSNNASMPVGSFRIYSQLFCKKINFNLFDEKLNKLLDDKGWDLFLKYGKTSKSIVIENNISFLSIKNFDNNNKDLNLFDDLMNSKNIILEKDKNFQFFLNLKQSLSHETFEKIKTL